jgi:hypothetical protein
METASALVTVVTIEHILFRYVEKPTFLASAFAFMAIRTLGIISPCILFKDRPLTILIKYAYNVVLRYLHRV